MSANNLNEHMDALKKDYMTLLTQVQSQQAQLMKAKEEFSAFQQTMMVCNDTGVQMNMETTKQMEVSKRLHAYISSCLHLVPAEIQNAVVQEMDKIRQYSLEPANPMAYMMSQMNAMQGQMVGGMPAGMVGGMPASPMMMRPGMVPMATASPRGKPNGMPNGIPLSVMGGMPHGMPPGIQIMAGQPYPGMPSGLPPQFAHPMAMQQMAQQLGMNGGSLNVNVSAPSRTHSNGPLSGTRTPRSTQSPRSVVEKPSSVPDNSQSHTPRSPNTPVDTMPPKIVVKEEQFSLA